uniref:Uncharacterized protein n=1 Tax=Rhizophora mucronata TaxID=61149 RepID=A0A2P2J002_RHIMU
MSQYLKNFISPQMRGFHRQVQLLICLISCH